MAGQNDRKQVPDCIKICQLKKGDYKKAIQFAITGMHFNWYLDSSLLLNLYGRYFWYLELARATQVLAAYVDDTFVGVLLAEIYGEEKKHQSFWLSLYTAAFAFLQNRFYKDGAGLYEETTQAMREAYQKNHPLDGEILFLAADPHTKIKGVGTALLRELERKEPGKTVFLHTDDACTYQFYEHRGFARVRETEIVLDMRKKEVPLHCFIYCKTL